MGAEALCRGASRVIGIEQSGRACSITRDNWQRFAAADQSWQVLRGDVGRRLSKLNCAFDRIYFDPPYESGLYEGVLAAIATHNLLSPAGELGVEHAPGQTLPEEIGDIIAQRTKKYGSTAVTFYRRIEN